jgi:hypothetical protein
MRFDLDKQASQDQTDAGFGGADLDWLGRNGSWVLMAFGVGLIALSALIADKEAVAVVLAFCGVAAVVFGVLLPRLEGSFVFSPTKFSATLSEARKAGVREDLTLEERADLILRLIDVEGDEHKYAKKVARKERGLRGGRGVGPPPERLFPLPDPLPFVRPSRADEVHETHRAFKDHVADAFRDGGWDVESLEPGSPFDFVASREGERNYVEAKLSRRLSAADAEAFIAIANQKLDPAKNDNFVLAVNRGALSKQASRAFVGPSPRIMVFEVPVEGW